ncbi:hypothetical protein L6164_036180 [Bauhinia variegata]|uniref:Uncharacterized protein n=1 Tax=Bauhinia variegata TaxID=167791 RepID=A0ACB9KG82_BAUVA|nr:hypothetical protein L6164_036180 [Bauhinia variegata]
MPDRAPHIRWQRNPRVANFIKHLLLNQWNRPVYDRSWSFLHVNRFSATDDLQYQNPKTKNVIFSAKLAGGGVARIQITYRPGGLTHRATPRVNPDDGESKIRQLGVPVGVEQDIGGLDVPVNDQGLAFVKELHGTCDLHGDLNALRPRWRGGFMEPVVEGGIGHELHDEQLVVGRVMTRPQEVDDVWVLTQRREHSYFVLELGVVVLRLKGSRGLLYSNKVVVVFD